jgi:hypothetical protein
MDSNFNRTRDADGALYSVGECPVCADSGAVLLLKAADTGRLVFFCPLCGVAWGQPPADRQLDEINRLDAFAPSGVMLPTRAEALRTGLALTEVALRDWLPHLDSLVDRPVRKE